MKDKTIIFSDGSSRGNPGPGGWGAILVRAGKVQELGGREDRTTNNRMEMKALVEVLALVEKGEEVLVNTDSKYVIQGITSWVTGWKRNGWMTKEKKEVLNRDLWEALSNAVEGKKIEWNYVGGHTGIPGNERCDEIATGFADNTRVDLYDGTFVSYGKDILSLDGVPEQATEKKRSTGKAYSYLSLLDGVAMRHATWPECEARVKGKNAKFKKTLSPEDEKSILESWGVSL